MPTSSGHFRISLVFRDLFYGSVLRMGYQKKEKDSEESWVKGKQVRILYDLVTVIRERDFCNRSLMEGCNLQRFQNCEFRIGEDWLLHWEDEELRIDLSARKPANCLVQGVFPDHE